MKPLTGLSVVLAALELHSPVGMAWGLIMLPAALQCVYDGVRFYRKYKALQIAIKQIEDSMNDNTKL